MPLSARISQQVYEGLHNRDLPTFSVYAFVVGVLLIGVRAL